MSAEKGAGELSVNMLVETQATNSSWGDFAKEVLIMGSAILAPNSEAMARRRIKNMECLRDKLLFPDWSRHIQCRLDWCKECVATPFQNITDRSPGG